MVANAIHAGTVCSMAIRAHATLASLIGRFHFTITSGKKNNAPAELFAQPCGFRVVASPTNLASLECRFHFMVTFVNVYFDVTKSILSIILAMCTLKYSKAYFWQCLLWSIRMHTFHYFGNVYFEVFESILLAMLTLKYSEAYFWQCSLWSVRKHTFGNVRFEVFASILLAMCTLKYSKAYFWQCVLWSIRKHTFGNVYFEHLGSNCSSCLVWGRRRSSATNSAMPFVSTVTESLSG